MKMTDSENCRESEKSDGKIKIEPFIDIDNSRARKYPRIYAVTLSILIPLLFLIALCFLFGSGLASLEGPSELEANNQLLADVEERYHRVDDFLVTIENGYDDCITKYMNILESGETPSDDDLMTFVKSCTQDSKSKARGKVQYMKNEDLDNTVLTYNWYTCFLDGEENSKLNSTMGGNSVLVYNEWYDSYNEWKEIYVGEGKSELEAREKALAQADGFQNCHVNFAGGAMFWFTIMTTIGYGNTSPVTDGGRLLVYLMGFMSILLFSFVMGQAGSIFLTIVDDFFECIGLKRFTYGVAAAFFWLTILWLWLLVIAIVSMSYMYNHFGSERDNEFNLDDAYWYAFVSVTTVGFGDYYLPQDIATPKEMFIVPLLMLIGFVMDANFLLKLTELFISAMRSSSEKLDDNMKSIRASRCNKQKNESSICFDEELQKLRGCAVLEEEKEEELKMYQTSKSGLFVANDRADVIYDPLDEVNNGVSFNATDQLCHRSTSSGSSRKTNSRNIMLASKASQSTRGKVQNIQDIIGQDDEYRDVKSLIVPDDLFNAAMHIVSLTSFSSSPKLQSQGVRRKHVVILSGFPYCIDENPPLETDGPPGTVAIARCMFGLGFDSVMIVTDECNESAFQAAIGNSNYKHKDVKPILLAVFPSEQNMNEEDYTRMQTIVYEKCDLLIACERAGPGADGKYYTMRGIDMTSMGLLAPLHKMVEMIHKRNNDDDTDVKFIAIGGGGNELGMGKVIDKIRTNPKMSNGDLIGAVTPADYLIAASVSNCGGYALAAACALVKSDYDDGDDKEADSGADGKKSIEDWLEVCVPSAEHETKLLNQCVAAACRDDVISGKMKANVDGTPFKATLSCLQSVKDACLGGNGDEVKTE